MEHRSTTQNWLAFDLTYAVGWIGRPVAASDVRLAFDRINPLSDVASTTSTNWSSSWCSARSATSRVRGAAKRCCVLAEQR